MTDETDDMSNGTSNRGSSNDSMSAETAITQNYLTEDDIKKIAVLQLDLVVSRNAAIHFQMQKNKLKARSAVVLEWMDVSFGYINAMKLLFDKNVFADGRQHELLVEVFSYNYFVLYYILDRLELSEADSQLATDLHKMSSRFLAVPEYRHDLQLTVHVCRTMIEAKVLSEDTAKLNIDNNHSDASEQKHQENKKQIANDFYPTCSEPDDGSTNKRKSLISISIQKVVSWKPSHVFLVDIRNAEDFYISEISKALLFPLVNIDPILVRNCQSFSEILDAIKRNSMDAYRRLSRITSYKYIVFYSNNNRVGNTELKFDSILRRQIKSSPPFVYWLDGGAIELEDWIAKFESKHDSKPGPITDSFESLPKSDFQDGLWREPPAPKAAKIESPPNLDYSRPPLPNPLSATNIPVSSARTMTIQRPQTENAVSRRTSFIPLVRLFNFGSTCYMNSMIQCLFTTSYFQNLFINRGKFSQILHSEKLSLALSFNHLFMDFYKADGYYIVKPMRFVSLCAQLKPDFRVPYEQQDTSQFLYFIMERLHNELKITDTPENREMFKTGDPETDPFALYSSRNGYIKWHDSLVQSEGVSPINGLFQIQQESCLHCGRCGYQSYNFDYSSMLNLNLKGDEYHLSDLILKNLKVEELSDRFGNAWKCPSCEKLAKRLFSLEHKCAEYLNTKYDTPNNETDQSSKKRNFFSHMHKKSKDKQNGSSSTSNFDYSKLNLSMLDPEERTEYESLKSTLLKPNISFKSTSFIKLPKVLIIYLAKFDLYQNKLTNVNLHFARTLKFKLTRDGKEVSYQYQLSSWIDHLGSSISSGHYTAVVSRNNEWFYCDDENISRLEYTGNEVKDPDAYLLFYTLVN